MKAIRNEYWLCDNSNEKGKNSSALLTLGGMYLSQRDGTQADGEEFPQGTGHHGSRSVDGLWQLGGVGLGWVGWGGGGDGRRLARKVQGNRSGRWSSFVSSAVKGAKQRESLSVQDIALKSTFLR